MAAQKYYKKDDIPLELPVENLIELDIRFKPYIEKFGKIELENRENPYHALVRAIIYQQLSGKAAGTIYNRFLALFNEKHPTTDELINTLHEKLRSVGLSNRKAEYIKSIAKFFAEHLYTKSDFEKITEEEIRHQLIKIRGVGHWTIDMFLMFTLHRLDIFPVLDLGVQKGFTRMLNLKKLPTEKHMLKESKKWSPYRSIAAHYFWRIADEEKSN